MPQYPAAPIAFRLPLSTVAALANLLARAGAGKVALPQCIAASFRLGRIRTKRLLTRSTGAHRTGGHRNSVRA